MFLRRIFKMVVCMGLTVASAPMSAQTASGDREPSAPESQPELWLSHDQGLVATYDSLADSTHLALTTHKGKYFLWVQRPRLIWIVSYLGRTPGIAAPRTVDLVFRTQNPQAAANNHLIVEFAGLESLEVTSVAAHSDAGPMVWSHFMRFPIPIADLTRGLSGERMRLSVGGIRVTFKPDQMEALRDLLRQVGAWPPPSSAGGA